MVHLTVDGLVAFLRHYPDAKVLDVSFAHERETFARLLGDHHVPWYTTELQPNPVFLGEVLKHCSPDDPVLLISRGGGRSHEAAVLLESAGFKRVYNVLGGCQEIIGGFPNRVR